MISMKKQRFSSRPRTKVRRHGPPGSARAQLWGVRPHFSRLACLGFTCSNFAKKNRLLAVYGEEKAPTFLLNFQPSSYGHSINTDTIYGPAQCPYLRTLDLRTRTSTSTSTRFNPLSPNSAQNQFSLNNIHRLSWAKSMRINKIITKRKIFDLLPNSLNLFFKEMYGDQFGEFVCRYCDLKG